MLIKACAIAALQAGTPPARTRISIESARVRTKPLRSRFVSLDAGGVRPKGGS